MKKKLLIVTMALLSILSILCFCACDGLDLGGSKTLITVEFRCDCGECDFADATDARLLTQHVENPSQIVAPNFKRKGYSQNGWSVDINSIYADTVVMPVWLANVYEITFDSNGGRFDNGNIVYNELFTVVYGNNLSSQKAFPKPYKEGFDFIGWYYNKKQITDDMVWDIDKDVTLVAKFKDKYASYTVSFNTNGGIITSPEGNELLAQTVKKPSDIKIPTVVKEGYIFVGWKGPDDVGVKDTWETAVFEAVWRKPYYVVAFDLSCNPFKWNGLAWSTVDGKTQLPDEEIEIGTAMGDKLKAFEPVEATKLKAMYWTVKGNNKVRVYQNTVLDESFKKYLVNGKLILQAQLANNSWT